METLINLVLASILYLAVHEGGHYFFALALGGKPKFEFSLTGIAVEFKVEKLWQFRLICEAGFGMGVLVGLALVALFNTPGAWIDKSFLLCYWSVFAVHFWTYPWRAPDGTNDFNGMCAHNKGGVSR